MKNEERRQALGKARRRALEYAEAADRPNLSGDMPESREYYREMAKMWAAVADALKVGDADADRATID